MLILRTTADMAAILLRPIDPDLWDLLSLRRAQLVELDLSYQALFVVAEPDDPPPIIDDALGFPVAVNLIDGTQLGDAHFTPSWEHRDRHPGWIELTWIMTDDGFAHVLLIPDRPDIDPQLRQLCDHPG